MTWVWTELAESIKPERKNGEPVPIGFLIRGATEHRPYSSWIKKGYVRRVDA